MSNTAKAQTNLEALLFNIEIPCAYYNAQADYNIEINNLVNGHGYRSGVYDSWYRDATVIAVQPLINYDVLDSNTMARIELFEYTVYTDKLQLQKSHSYFAFNESAFESRVVRGRSTSFIAAYYDEYRSKSRDGYYFTGSDLIDYITDPAKPMNVWDILQVGYNMNHGYRQGAIDKNNRNILAAIENTNAVYLDIRRVAYISLSVDGKVMAVEDDKLLQHLELTKTDDGFMFGDPAAIVGREIHFGLPPIPYSGTTIPEELWSEVFGK